MEFPFGTIFEILSRSSISTLATCRILSKECNSLTYESTFMNLHCQRTKTVSGYFLQSLKYNKYSSTFVSIDNFISNSSNSLSLDFLPVPIKIVSSTCQGLLLCVDQRNIIPKYYVCKPSIPNPKTRFHTEKIAMTVLKSNPLLYKIVRFSEPNFSSSNEYYYLLCEIFYSRTYECKQLQEVKLPYGEFFSCVPSICVYSSLHWLTNKNNIFAFDVYEEKYGMFSLPNNKVDYDHIQPTDYEGKLSVIYMRRDNTLMELWVMENYKEKVWSKRHMIDVQPLREKEPHSMPLMFYNADIALMSGFYGVLFFKFKNGSMNMVRQEEQIQTIGVLPFKSDFEPCNLKTCFSQKKHARDKRRRNNSKPIVAFVEILILMIVLFVLFFCFYF